jgi:hypothetical protein
MIVERWMNMRKGGEGKLELLNAQRFNGRTEPIHTLKLVFGVSTCGKNVRNPVGQQKFYPTLECDLEKNN